MRGRMVSTRIRQHLSGFLAIRFSATSAIPGRWGVVSDAKRLLTRWADQEKALERAIDGLRALPAGTTVPARREEIDETRKVSGALVLTGLRA